MLVMEGAQPRATMLVMEGAKPRATLLEMERGQARANTTPSVKHEEGRDQAPRVNTKGAELATT